VISAGGVGSLVGSLFAPRVSRRFGVGPTIIWCALASSLIGVLTPLAGGTVAIATVMVFLPQLLGDAARTVEYINYDTVVQTTTPDRVLGRVNATIDFVSHGIGPLGALAAAAIAELFGVRAGIAVGWAGMLAAVGFYVFSPLPRVRTVAPATAMSPSSPSE
jgi:MFS family permease